ncbi:EamA family transporter RarD [Cellulomonas sp. ACRRI]|uniref:EamA family transporter RarD n=1 Tax=Cellulomonas sp. ACRRI TaxID=2918188 RepID=UPI001EF255D7|nr:EamA family transporter RarD [Cellulomonas sp. ACRRI]MCG7287206.1 EamA family transporter RarD [Cellulomonas sp. ACRRI]
MLANPGRLNLVVDVAPPAAAAAAPTTTGALDPRGLAAGVGAYLLWGVLPLYFELLKPSGAVEVVAHRVLWSLVFCAVVLSATRTWRALGVVLRNRRTMALVAAASVLLAVNWLTFVFAALGGHVVDAALGYFINPLVTVLLAVVVLRERLRRTQWVALGFGVAAVVVITVGLGRLPWVALTLAGSFGVYGLLKNRVGRSVAAAPGLAAETLVLAPVSAVYLVWLGTTGGSTFTATGTWHALALAGTGIATALPLLLFGESARRLPLSVVGSLQYLAPVLQLVIGVLVLHETMPPARWWGFGLVWVALVLLTVDGVRTQRAQRLRAAAAAPAVAG